MTFPYVTWLVGETLEEVRLDRRPEMLPRVVPRVLELGGEGVQQYPFSDPCLALEEEMLPDLPII